MNIAQVLERIFDQENDLNENDWYLLYYQYQVLYQVLVLKNMQ